MSTHNIPLFFNIKRKIPLNYHKSAVIVFFLGTQALVRNSHGKRAISVRATEVLLYPENSKTISDDTEVLSRSRFNPHYLILSTGKTEVS